MKSLRRMGFSWILVMIMTVFSIPAVYAQTEEPVVKVGILSGQHSVIISSDVGFSIIDADTGVILQRFKPQERVIVAEREKDIAVNGKYIEGRAIRVTGIGAGEHYIEVNRHKYRGVMEITHTYNKMGLTIINSLPIEQYLYGVVAREISTEWPLEAVKAQAVAARSYAMANMHKHKKDGYDVCASTDCQVYGGLDSETAGAVKAVDETRGQVITYQGKLVPAYFHASSGGYTENSENVWGTFYPFLRGVVDYDQKAPSFKWEKTFKPNEISDLLFKAGYPIGELKAIVLSPLTAAPVTAPDRGISGRVKSIGFIGTQGDAWIGSGEKLRRILNLNSSLIDFRMVTPVKEALEFDITDSYGSQERKRMEINLPPTRQKEFLNEKGNVRHLSGGPGEVIVITGYGYGHGLGLSQWGARAMAERAPQGDDTYFEKILKHYYQGVEISKVY